MCSDFAKQQVFSDSSWKSGFIIFKITVLIREVENQHNQNISIVTFIRKLGSVMTENFFPQLEIVTNAYKTLKEKHFLKLQEV